MDRELRGGFVVDTSLINGVDFRIKTVQVNERTCTLQSWVVDLNKNLERFYFFYHSYIIGSLGAILLMYLGDRKSFTILQEWISFIRESVKVIPILLVGNRPKVDQERQISEEEGNKFAREHELAGYMEIASHNGYNMSNMFEHITILMLKHYE